MNRRYLCFFLFMMLVPEPPSLTLRLRPSFDRHGDAEHIDVQVVFDARARQANEVLFRHVLKRGSIRTQQYTAESVRLSSATGDVPLHTRDSNDATKREFLTASSLAAQRLTVQYRARPAHVDDRSPCGPQIALEQDGGGLSAAGQAFLLTIDADEADYQMSIEWDLASAPASTRAVCTWGEGPSIRFYGRPAVLEEAFFMVGPVKSYPAADTDSPYGTYWISQPPFDAPRLGQQVGYLLPQMRLLFRDDNPLFRVFIRHNAYKCVSGRGLFQGFVFAWNDIQNLTRDYTEFVFHELVHNWPRLGFSVNGPTPEELADGWFNEGIADYYSLVLPFQFGLTNEQDFVRQFNRRISGYYTNPERSMPNAEVPGNFWRPGHANRIPYQRGLMYFVALACQLRHAGKRSLDELIREMVAKRRASQPHGIKVWLQLLEAELGPKVHEDYQRMSAAELIRLPEDCMETFLPSSRWVLRRRDQEEFYLGFPEKCLASRPERMVRDLDRQSRAAIAGVHEGDIISPKFSWLFEAEDWDQQFVMLAVRGGREVELRWWPRSWTKVESYQFEHP